MADRPLVSELKRLPCVHYRLCVSRVYKTTESHEDGSSETKYRHEILSSNTQTIPFRLRDGDMEIYVDPRGAEIETVQVLNEFQEDNNTTHLAFGRFQMDLSSLPKHSDTVGYRYEEWILPVNQQVFVVGTASDERGKLRIRRPHQKGQLFFISLESEENLTKKVRQYARASIIAAGVFSGLGILLILL
ncbi:hypothetical protein NIES2134_105800 [Thermostichus vulcanus NIES-2134]|nr:hypothetical protein NIES2134_105800 [Thermostichus vulcanus NIES-2134]